MCGEVFSWKSTVMEEMNGDLRKIIGKTNGDLRRIYVYVNGDLRYTDARELKKYAQLR